MIRLYTILNDPIAYKKLLVYVRKYHIERYHRYNQLKYSQKDPRYVRGFRIPDMDTMEQIAWDYKKAFIDTRSKKDIALWLLEITE
jgi:hypothetical protein